MASRSTATMIDRSLGRPFLMVYSARMGRTGASDAIYRRAATPYYRVDVRDTLHLDFSDMNFWGGPLRDRGALGKMAPGARGRDHPCDRPSVFRSGTLEEAFATAVGHIGLPGSHRSPIGKGRRSTPVIDRHAVRAILLTPEHQILLLRVRPPQGGHWFWIAPGGGINAGETVEAGLRRELQEEVGLDRFAVGPLVRKRQHTFDWGDRRICQLEEYYIVHVERFEPRMSDATEITYLDRFRWWPVAELAHSVEPLTPRVLADIVARYLVDGPPRGPLAVEVHVD